MSNCQPCGFLDAVFGHWDLDFEPILESPDRLCLDVFFDGRVKNVAVTMAHIDTYLIKRSQFAVSLLASGVGSG